MDNKVLDIGIHFNLDENLVGNVKEDIYVYVSVKVGILVIDMGKENQADGSKTVLD